jgi:hypothetical protein
VCLWLLTSFKQVYAAQMTKVNHAVTSVQTAQAKSAKNLNSRVDTVASEVGDMTGIVNAISHFDRVCSQDLEGQNGPTRFFFACSTANPGS